MNIILTFLDKYFGITSRGSTVATEVKGGIITFLAMVYILTVNPAIISDGVGDSVSWDALFTSTAIAAIVSCLLMGIYARFPVALAPGMGVNAFLSYTICIAMEFTYAQALLAVFFSGILFLILSVTGARTRMMEAFPTALSSSFTAGIGLFIAIVGLFNAGIIVHGDSSALALGDLGSKAVLLGIISIAVTLVLWFRNNWGAVLIGIIVSVIAGFAMGLIEMPEEFVSSPDFSLVGMLFDGFTDFPTSRIAPFIAVILALTVMDMFDTTGTIMAVASRAKDSADVDMGLTNKALEVDSVSTVAGAVFGTTTTTSFIESCTGIESGARTGLMPVITAFMFIIALFFCPVFGIVTNACIVGALVLVGILMIAEVKNVDWKDSVSAATAFMTIAFIGLSGSITDGMAFGTITYIVAMIATGRFKEISKVILVLGAVFIAYFVLYYGYIL